jgi:DNA primase
VRIPDEKIEEIRFATDIVELIGGFVALKKAGKSWKGLCPFHTEKTPSFHVDAERGVYHCFGCSRGGDAIDFLMEREGHSFIEAVRFLAERAGIALPRPTADGTGAPDVRETVMRVNQAAHEWFRRVLRDTGRGAAARAYLASRAIGPEAIETFGIGCAPTGWDGLLTHLVRAGHDPELLERAGLVARRERGGGFYDRFRDRVIFPIFGATGQPIAFGGRILGEGEPKYLNSPETPVFRKGRGLFGLHTNRAAVRDAGWAVLVEGYTDLIALFDVGVRNAVAPLGTALTEEQARLLAHHVRSVVLLYDGDDAGQAAALRALPALLAAGLSVRVARLPAGVDPDDFARRSGAAAVREVLDAAPGWIAHVVAAASDEGREAQAHRVVALLALVEDSLTRAVLATEASAALGLPEALLRSEAAARGPRGAAAPEASRGGVAAAAVGGARAPRPAESGAGQRRGASVPEADGAHRAERGLLSLCLREPLLVPLVARHVRAGDFADPTLGRLAGELFNACAAGAATDVAHRLLNRFRDDAAMRGLITESLAPREDGAPGDRLAQDYVKKILTRRLGLEMKRQLEELRKAQDRRDEDAQLRLHRDYNDTKQTFQQIVNDLRIEA